MQAILSSVMTIFFYAMLVAAVWKLFQAAAELTEIKKLLTDIRQNTAHLVTRPAASAAFASPEPAAPAPISLEAAEELLRQVAAESEAQEKTQVPG